MLRNWDYVSLILIISLFLFSACSTDHERARKKLEASGTQFTEQAFVDSVSKGDGETVKLFLAAGMNPNARNTDGKPALVLATLAGNEAMVDQLLDAGANLNAKTKDGQTALMGAAVKRQRPNCKYPY